MRISGFNLHNIMQVKIIPVKIMSDSEPQHYFYSNEIRVIDMDGGELVINCFAPSPLVPYKSSIE